MKKAVLKSNSEIWLIFEIRTFRSIHKSNIPPTNNATATIYGLKSLSSIYFPTVAPIISAGITPTSVFHQSIHVAVFSDDVLEGPKGTSLFQKYITTAKMAPSCITTSNIWAKEPVNPIKLFTKIRCPVDDIGRNSVNPSTIPRIIALIKSFMERNWIICLTN